VQHSSLPGAVRFILRVAVRRPCYLAKHLVLLRRTVFPAAPSRDVVGLSIGTLRDLFLCEPLIATDVTDEKCSVHLELRYLEDRRYHGMSTARPSRQESSGNREINRSFMIQFSLGTKVAPEPSANTM
jgi:hypothetical protein